MTTSASRIYTVARGRLLVVECTEHGVVWQSSPRKGRAAELRRALAEHQAQHQR